jgi:hypothetical protein
MGYTHPAYDAKKATVTDFPKPLLILECDTELNRNKHFRSSTIAGGSASSGKGPPSPRRRGRILTPPMDLRNMRSLGVTGIDAYRECGHQSTIDVSDLPGDLAVPDIRFRLRCTKCGERPAVTRPDWSNYRLRDRLCRQVILLLGRRGLMVHSKSNSPIEASIRPCF